MKKTKAQEIKTVEKAEEKFGTSSVDVLSKSGSFIRAFSAVEQGEDFVRLAEQYAGKVNGSVRKS